MNKLNILELFTVSFLCCLLASCASRTKPAPIENVTQVPGYLQAPPPGAAPPATAAAATQSANTPAQLGSLSKNNSVAVNNSAINNTTSSAIATPKNGQQVTAGNANSGTWIMPCSGVITAKFSQASKGIDIAGTEGSPIYAINGGKVVYSGNGLKGYGNLIIIKHDNTYLSAYAHNKVNLVKEGAVVKRGQKIAEMGLDDSGQASLHLELRQNGKPIDPLSMITE